VFAVRTFFRQSLLVILTTRSYFSGGSNDRTQPYSLGPGRSGAKDDFNEANMKPSAVNSDLKF
jgi:hypothetical protein